MAYRDVLIAGLTTALSNYSNFAVSSELPFQSGNIPLHRKNMKRVYLDEQQDAVTEFIPTLDNRTIYQTESTVTLYLTVDAKNEPQNLANVLTACQAAKGLIPGVVRAESALTTEIIEDQIIYSIEYNFLTI